MSIDNENVERLFEEITTALKEGAFEKVIETVDQAFTARSANWSRVPEPLIALAFIYKALAHGELGEFASAVACYDEVITRFGDSDAPNLQYLTAWALSDKGLTQIKMGSAEEALHTCEELERRLGALTDNKEIEFTWRARCVRALALMVQKKSRGAMDAFRSAYASFPLNNEAAMREMQEIVPDLIANGASENDLVEILSSDKAKSSALVPLIVALRQRTGVEVRASVEVLEVAADINKDIDTKMAN